MRNALFAGLTAALLSVGIVTPAFANTYTDSNEISDWSADHIEILQDLGIVVGYPDGTFRPAANITREEMAVMLLNGMVALENSILETVLNNDQYLYEELVSQQTQLLEALAAIDEVKAKEAVEKNNFVAIGLGYGVSNSETDDEVNIQLIGKVQIIEISDTFAISVRPFINTNTEVGGSVTLDADITNNLELFTGIGAAYRADQDSTGALTGFDDDVVPYVTAGAALDLSDDTVVTIDAKSPLNSGEGKEVTVSAGVGWKF